MKLKIQPYYLLLFTAGFMLFTVIGTVSHEYGHIVVAKWFGYKTTLHYGSASWNENYGWEEYRAISSKYSYEINNDLTFQRKKEYERIIKRLNDDGLIVLIGGPLQTILTGLIGLTIILFRRKTIRKNGLKLIDWLSVFLSLFWLREVFNVTRSVTLGILKETCSYFSGDEARISTILDLPIGTFSIILGVLGLIISLFIIFKIVPYNKRLAFITGGLIGGISGFVLWMNIIGPKILP